MARGRMLNNSISRNKRVNSMSDRAQLMYTWTISHLDKNGVIHGDPALLRSIVVPRRGDISAEEAEGYIQEWVAADLVVWYEHDDDLWLWFPGFDDNQVNLRKDREPETGYPVYGSMPDDCRKVSGSPPRQAPPKRREDKIREEKIKRGRPKAAKAEKDDLYTALKESFEAVYGAFDNYPKEGTHIKRLCSKVRARAPDDPEPFAKSVLTTYLSLTQNGNKFWKGQPFLPSALDADGIWPRVLKELDNTAVQQQAAEDAMESGFTFKSIGGLK